MQRIAPELHLYSQTVKRAWHIALLLTVALAAVSCSVQDPMDEGDFPLPIEVNIAVQNAAGDNLLDPASEGALSLDKIVATFRGRAVTLDPVSKAGALLAPISAVGPSTSVSAATTFAPISAVGPRGVALSPGQDLSLSLVAPSNNLLFGPLDGRAELTDEPLVLSWGDGRTSEIRITNRFDPQSFPVLDRHFYYEDSDFVSEAAVIIIL